MRGVGVDAELVAAARAGDRDGLGVLIGRHRPMVLALSQRLLGNPMLAAGAVQEATVAATKDLSGSAHPSGPAPGTRESLST